MSVVYILKFNNYDRSIIEILPRALDYRQRAHLLH